MSILPKKWLGRLIPLNNIPKYYIKNQSIYETKTNIKFENSFLTNYRNTCILSEFKNIEKEFVSNFIKWTNETYPIIKILHSNEVMSTNEKGGYYTINELLSIYEYSLENQ